MLTGKLDLWVQLRKRSELDFSKCWTGVVTEFESAPGDWGCPLIRHGQARVELFIRWEFWDLSLGDSISSDPERASL